ncbi:ARM repeat superfamily protein, putative isoform 1 [Hibiscus syriacus]|uniref:Glycosyltransferase family 92 protein n=1 Tax=Hibiscus syriacus TaxID=106335 RepID=A0A6A2Y4N9_HIBSY|nr:ARM repeat superfamily protein, putative isoform 1 [Hibiscus syriacus]
MKTAACPVAAGVSNGHHHCIKKHLLANLLFHVQLSSTTSSPLTPLLIASSLGLLRLFFHGFSLVFGKIMESEQRRKRRRSYRPNSRPHFLSLKLLMVCLFFLVLPLFLSSSRFPIRTVHFHPLLSVSSFSILSKISLQGSLRGKSLFPLHWFLSVDEYDGSRSIVRCPLPPLNYSATAELRRRGDNVHRNSSLRLIQRFIHGIEWCKNEGFVLVSKAVAAAQEEVSDRGARGELNWMPSVAKLYNSESYMMEKNRGKYELCAFTMLWNQASALREWIMYHAWLGVERWFIYDNNSDDGTQQVIEELDFLDYNVSRHAWPWIKTQEAGFSHCALRARDECKWVGFFDVDEFYYFPHHHRRGLLGLNSLRSLVANHSSSTTIAEIRTVYHSFGPSGLTSPPSQGVTVGYTCRLQSLERQKSIVRPDLLNETLLNVVWGTFRTKFFRRVATYVVDWQENQNQGSKDRAPGLGTRPLNHRIGNYSFVKYGTPV